MISIALSVRSLAPVCRLVGVAIMLCALVVPQAVAADDKTKKLEPLPVEIIESSKDKSGQAAPSLQSGAKGKSSGLGSGASKASRAGKSGKWHNKIGPWRNEIGPGDTIALPQIKWRVENSFRFFTSASDTELHRATYLSLTDEERQNPILSAERALEKRHSDGWAAAVIDELCWKRKRNQHACPTRGAYINPKQHKIVAQLANVRDDQSVDCTWRAQRVKARRKPTIKTLTVPCDIAVKFSVPYPSGILLSVLIGGQPVAEARVKVKDLLIVGMGDSFASGEGNPDVPVRFSRERAADYGEPRAGVRLAGYPARIGAWREIGDKRFIRNNARWVDQACHRSLYSHQLRAALQLAVEDAHRAVTYVGLSCSGAETTFGLFLYYKGNEWVPNPPQYSQISAAAIAQCGDAEAPDIDLPEAYHLGGKLPELNGLVLRRCGRKQSRAIDLLFLSVGGNDIGFSRLVANAVLSNRSMLRKLGGWFGQVQGVAQAKAALKRLPFRYKSLNRALHNILHIPWSQSRRIILTGYPRMAMMRDGKSICPDGAAGMTVAPAFSLSSAKAAAGGRIADKLHKVMKKAAKVHKWSFVEAHRRSFLGRGICAGATTTSEFDTVNDLRLPRKSNGIWQPYNPADWRAYIPRQRWFRTPNDAFMTGNFHVRSSFIQKALKLKKFSWFQLLLASTYSGAFHPTAEGQAAIADALVRKARKVLQRYERRG